MTFTLISRPTLPFRLVRRWAYFGIDTVEGITLDGKSRTVARAIDVVFS